MTKTAQKTAVGESAVQDVPFKHPARSSGGYGPPAGPSNGRIQKRNRGSFGGNQRGGNSRQRDGGFGREQPEEIYLAPKSIRFTQNEIGSTFTDGKSLAETYRLLATRKIKKRNIPMIEVVYDDGEYWTLNNRRLAVFQRLEEKRLCKCIRVRVKPDKESITEMLMKRTTTGRRPPLVRLTAIEAEAMPANQVRLTRTRGASNTLDNRKPVHFSAERYQAERREKEARTYALRNPIASKPAGWGQEISFVEEGDNAERALDVNDLEFELADGEGTPPGALLHYDSGFSVSSGSSSNVSLTSPRTDSVGGLGEEEIDFDYEEDYLCDAPTFEDSRDDEDSVTFVDGVSADDHETVTFVHGVSADDNDGTLPDAGGRTVVLDSSVQRPSPTPSEMLTTDFGRMDFGSRRFVHGGAAPSAAASSAIFPSSTTARSSLFDLANVLNRNVRKRPLSYYYGVANKIRMQMDPEPAEKGFYCGDCDFKGDCVGMLVFHKDKSGHWASRSKQFDSIRHLVNTEQLKLTKTHERRR